MEKNAQKSKKVSVIIPTFNRADYLKESVRSAVGQTYKPLEIIVVDDGSTDATREILQPYRDNNSIIYLYQKNSGKPGIARNHALSYATGEYICFLDSDDIRMEDSVERSVTLLDEHENIGMVCTDWLFFDHPLRNDSLYEASWIKRANYLETLPQELIAVKCPDFVLFQKEFLYELFHSNFVFTSSVVTRRSLLDRVGYFDESLTIGEDCDLWMRLGELGNIAFITAPAVYRRRHSGSITCSLARNIIEDTRVIEKFMKNKKPIPHFVKKRFYKRLECFYFSTGYYFFELDNLAQAGHQLMMALRYNPRSFRNALYLMGSLLPLRGVHIIRKIKHLLYGTVPESNG